MKFYLKCTHVGKLVQGWFTSSRYELQLVSIAIVCENGVNFFEVNADCDKTRIDPYEMQQLPSQSVWKKQSAIKAEVLHFLRTQAGERTVEILGWNGASDFITLRSIFGSLSGELPAPCILPSDIINVGQTVAELVQFMDASFFGPESDFPLVLDPASHEAKMQMFFSHPMCPEFIENANALQQAIWLRQMDMFVSKQKASVIDALRIPEIEDDADDNSELS